MNMEQTIRERFQKSGLSIKKLTDQAGTPYSAVHAFLNFQTKTVTLSTASRLCNVLGLELRPIQRKVR